MVGLCDGERVGRLDTSSWPEQFCGGLSSGGVKNSLFYVRGHRPACHFNSRRTVPTRGGRYIASCLTISLEILAID
jgi:hypothetical protein